MDSLFVNKIFEKSFKRLQATWHQIGFKFDSELFLKQILTKARRHTNLSFLLKGSKIIKCFLTFKFFRNQ